MAWTREQMAARAAKELRESLLQEIRIRSTQSRIESLTQSGQEHLAARQFREAAQDFESALNLDRGNAQLQDVARRARGLLDHADRAGQLITQAEQAMAESKLADAHKLASDAVALDSESLIAREVLDSVQAEIDRREKARTLRNGLSRDCAG